MSELLWQNISKDKRCRKILVVEWPFVSLTYSDLRHWLIERSVPGGEADEQECFSVFRTQRY